MSDQHDSTQDSPERRRPLGRRDLIKLGTGVIATALTSSKGTAQGQGTAAPPAPGSLRKPGLPRPFTGPGYKYTANRLGNNGPMDDVSAKIVKFVHGYDPAKMSPTLIRVLNRTMLDSMASIIAGFEEQEVRIAAQCAAQAQPIGLKSTVFGYGITTTPELAAFANGVQVRVVDFNDDSAHTSNLIPGVLAVGEALHSTGLQVLAAVAIGYEVAGAGLGAGETIAPAMGAGKLMGLDEDRLANALTLAMTPHQALNKGVGAMSMWKGSRSAEATKCGIWATILARQGMTGPPQPFEGRGGLWSRNGRNRDFTLPVQADGQMAVERNWFKRRPSEASSQGILVLMPEIRGWAKPDEIASIHYDMNDLGEVSDNPKWDPRNRETADHSMPYMLARALLDGDIYLDSFTEAKYMDPAARALMDKMTFGQVRGWAGNGPVHIIIRKKNGEERAWDTYDGARVITMKEQPQLTDEEIFGKFNRACNYMKMNPAQRDRARTIWGNLASVKDIGEAIQTLAKFGQPKPL